MSGRPCTICVHPSRAEIEATVAGGASISKVSRDYAVGRMALARHASGKRCKPKPGLTKAAPPRAVQSEHVVAVRRLISAGQADSGLVERLAVTFAADAEHVRALLAAAGAELARDELPVELAREESIALGRRVRRKAEESADWKTALAAQAHMDRLRGVGQTGASASTAWPRERVIDLVRQIAAAVATWPDAVTAVREVVARATA